MNILIICRKSRRDVYIRDGALQKSQAGSVGKYLTGGHNVHL